MLFLIFKIMLIILYLELKFQNYRINRLKNALSMNIFFILYCNSFGKIILDFF